MSAIRTAFVLGAGLGTRLRPLTLVRPKPLIPVCNRPLIEHGFDHLLAHGVERFVVNTHWLADVFAQDFPTGEYRGAPIAFRHEPDVLETAGGIKNVEDLLGAETFAVYNGDIYTDLPLAPALAAHRAQGNEVTMILRSSGGPLQVQWDASTRRVVDLGDRLGSRVGPGYLFTGVYLVEPRFLARLTPGEKISVVPHFLRMIQSGEGVGGVVIDEGQWWDLGTREQYLAVHQYLAQQHGGAPWVHPTAQVAPDALLSGATAVGPGAVVGAGAKLHDSLLWPGARVAAGSELRACIVTGAHPASGWHEACDF